jgi:hypothetical protein
MNFLLLRANFAFFITPTPLPIQVIIVDCESLLSILGADLKDTTKHNLVIL